MTSDISLSSLILCICRSIRLFETGSSLISSNFSTFLRQTHSSLTQHWLLALPSISFSSLQTSDMLDLTPGERQNLVIVIKESRGHWAVFTTVAMQCRSCSRYSDSITRFAGSGFGLQTLDSIRGFRLRTSGFGLDSTGSGFGLRTLFLA